MKDKQKIHFYTVQHWMLGAALPIGSDAVRAARRVHGWKLHITVLGLRLFLFRWQINNKPKTSRGDRSTSSSLILDFTMTHPLYGRSHVHPIGQLTNIRRSDPAPEPDGVLRVTGRKKISHYRQLYISGKHEIVSRDSYESGIFILVQKSQ